MLKYLVAALILAALPQPAHAQPASKLTIALSATPSSTDPQFYIAGRDVQLARQIFDGLTNQDERQRIVPGLALSWKALDPLTWEFTLRPNVTFHDGTPFTAAAVVTSIARVSTIRDSPSSFTPYVKDIAHVDIISPTVIHIVTLQPTPLLPANLSKIAILPEADAALTTQDLNAGKGVTGTGPFRFQDWRPGDDVSLTANPDWWGGKTAWTELHLKIIADPAARTAALLSGDVDLIQDVPPQSQAALQASRTATLVTTRGNRLILFQLDSNRAQSPMVTDPDGNPLPTNPLRDPRVRKALNLALNRQAIVDRIMNGNAVPAGQLVPEGYPGYVPDLPPLQQDTAAAKALLTQAGYPNGFGLTIDSSNGQYPNDTQITQAVAQMLTRIGIKTKVEALAPAIFQTRAAKLEFSVTLQGAAVETGEASSMIRPVIATYDPDRGYGTGNRGRYSNPELDKLLAAALIEMDASRREDLLRQATKVAVGDSALLPVLFLNNTWGIRKTLTFTPRADGLTLAIDARPR